MKQNPKETLKFIFFPVLSWKEGRDEGQLLAFRTASLSESTQAGDYSQYHSEVTTTVLGSSEPATAGCQGRWVLPDRLLCPIMFTDL